MINNRAGQTEQFNPPFASPDPANGALQNGGHPSGFDQYNQ